jgi:hypothetical protein
MMFRLEGMRYELSVTVVQCFSNRDATQCFLFERDIGAVFTLIEHKLGSSTFSC